MQCWMCRALSGRPPFRVTRLGKTERGAAPCSRCHCRRVLATSGARDTTRSTCPLLWSIRTVPWAKSSADQARRLTSLTRRPHRSINRVHHDLGYTVSSAKGGTAHVTLSRYFNPYDRPVRFDEFDRGRVWGAGAPL